MNYVVVRVCCFDCLRFLAVYHLHFNNLTKLKQYLKDISIDSNDGFIVYDETCSCEIIRYCFYD